MVAGPFRRSKLTDGPLYLQTPANMKEIQFMASSSMCLFEEIEVHTVVILPESDYNRAYHTRCQLLEHEDGDARIMMQEHSAFVDQYGQQGVIDSIVCMHVKGRPCHWARVACRREGSGCASAPCFVAHCRMPNPVYHSIPHDPEVFIRSQESYPRNANLQGTDWKTLQLAAATQVCLTPENIQRSQRIQDRVLYAHYALWNRQQFDHGFVLGIFPPSDAFSEACNRCGVSTHGYCESCTTQFGCSPVAICTECDRDAEICSGCMSANRSWTQSRAENEVRYGNDSVVMSHVLASGESERVLPEVLIPQITPSRLKPRQHPWRVDGFFIYPADESDIYVPACMDDSAVMFLIRNVQGGG
jgi:hypothetical protein